MRDKPLGCLIAIVCFRYTWGKELGKGGFGQVCHSISSPLTLELAFVLHDLTSESLIRVWWDVFCVAPGIYLAKHEVVLVMCNVKACVVGNLNSWSQ